METPLPFVSVIVPNYNHAQFLERRIESILNQSYPYFSIIILDDCSTDDSRDVIEKFRHSPKVANIVYNERNTGSPFLQWKKGILMATGSLIWIAESDDTCETCMLESLVKAYVSHDNVAIAYSTSKKIDENDLVFFSPLASKDKCMRGIVFLRKYLLMSCAIENASSAIFPREKALAIPDEYLVYKGAGDYLFWTELAERGNVIVVNKGYNRFRIHRNSTTLRMFSNGDNLFAEKEILEHICKRVNPSKWRRRLASTCRVDRIMSMSFISEEVKSKVIECWGGSSVYKMFDRLLLKIYMHFRAKNKYV